MMDYKDKTQPIENRVENLLSLMTIEEKIGQLCMFEVKRGVEFLREHHVGTIIHQFGEPTLHFQKELGDRHRLQIPVLMSLDCIHGHAFFPDATIFPTQIGLSCTWDDDLIREMGRVTAREMTVTGVHWTFSPLLDMVRDLRWGRCGETFGEDPYLTGRLSAAIIKGYQGESLSDPESVLACAKHFAGYCDSMGGRDSTETTLSRRHLRHDIFPPYQMAVDAGCATFMAGYQSLDGTPCSASRWLLTDVLRKEMGFNGFVVSDWENLQRLIDSHQVCSTQEDAAAVFINSGNDMVMTTDWFPGAAMKAISQGKLAVAVIDEACRRILNVKFAMGLFDHKRYPDLGRIPAVVGSTEHLDVALKCAVESVVLLENRGDILPLKPSVKRIAVVGPNADDIVAHLGDWAIGPGGYPEHFDKNLADIKTRKATLLDQLRLRAGSGIVVDHCKACDVNDSSYDEIVAAVGMAEMADVVIAVVGDNTSNAGEWRDRANPELSGKQLHLLQSLRSTNKPMVVILMSSKPLTIPWAGENADAVLAVWNPGIMGGKAIAGILFGDYNPSGKLTTSFPWDVAQQPVRYNQSGGWHGGPNYIDLPKEQGLRQYVFGQGKSYTSYTYSDLKATPHTVKTGGHLDVSVTVANSGKQAGTEIVQLYVRDVVASVTRPPKLLKNYTRVDLKPGEKKTVSLRLAYADLAILNAEEKWVVEPGEFEICVGPSSKDETLLKAIISAG